MSDKKTDKNIEKKQPPQKQTASPVCYMAEFPEYFNLDDTHQEKDNAAQNDTLKPQPPKPDRG
jgi:hypothetical protein